MQASEHFDAIVVGSGFGGSVTAYRLAEAGLRVCVLERGKRYPPGSFPRAPYDMARNFWDPNSARFGLFQVWGFKHMDALVAAGLGGGSLIYANVHLRMPEAWFVHDLPGGAYEPWPFDYAALEPHYERVEAILKPTTYPVEAEPYAGTPKMLAYRAAAEARGLAWSLPPISVTFADEGRAPVPGEPIHDPTGSTTNNLHGRTRYTCRLCGECDVGCNFGSKNTLDYNYLSLAEKHLAVLRDLCDVKTFAPRPDGGYQVTYRQYAPEDEGRVPYSGGQEVTISGDRLVLAAGTFGTNYLLQRNKAAFRLSARFGKGFSGNGDILGLLSHATRVIDGQPTPLHLAPSFGPVITSMVSVPDSLNGGTGPGYFVQEGGLPAFFSWILQLTDVRREAQRGVRFLLHRLRAMFSKNPETDLDVEIMNMIGKAERSDSFLPLLGMGRDTPGGEFELTNGPPPRLQLSWDPRGSANYIARARSTMQSVADAIGAGFRDNPTWYLRKLITVHGLGGCAVGHSAADGVVDRNGQVFGYPGFYIADGSVLPGPVGANPSLTIAALADRFADALVEPVTT